jgi:pimeloyl-ACP methyl ester carboxylesterase
MIRGRLSFHQQQELNVRDTLHITLLDAPKLPTGMAPSTQKPIGGRKRILLFKPAALICATAIALLTGCGGANQESAAVANSSPRPMNASTLGLLDPLAPEDDLGGTDTAQVDYHSRSLYSGPAPRPGPDILYAAPPRAPQLENTGIWRANPILVSGASAYRRGEFLYQDFLYDDRGANAGLPDPNDQRRSAETFSRGNGTYTYPTDPVYANNAADIVELRIKPRSDFTAFRITMNSLIDAERVGITIALGDSASPRPFPFGANVSAPAQYFLTAYGNQAVLTNAADGSVLSPAPTITVDMVRRQFEIRVPKAAWDPGQNVVRVAAGAGLWDKTANRYLLPAATADTVTPGGGGTLANPPAFFNVAFRFNEPIFGPGQSATETSYWRDNAQAKALASGDISSFFARVDFSKLTPSFSDDMPGQPQGVPQTGSINRIFASHVETKQGVDFSLRCGRAPVCKGEYRGQLQPYTLYVPVKPVPATGYGLTLLLHSLGGNHNQYANSRNQSQLGERGDGHLVATPLGRGPDGWYVDDAAADTFEMWADIARHYPLDPAMTAISGYSMGGHGSFKFSTRYPDLFAKVHTVVGPPALGIWAPPNAPTGGEGTNTNALLPGLRNVPIMMWVQAADELVPYTGTSAQAQSLDALGYRYRFDTYTSGEHLTLARHDQYQGSADFLGDARVDRNPSRITYVANPVMDVPGRTLVGNHAYWLSGIAVRDTGSAVPRGGIDVKSHGFGEGDPVASATQSGAGTTTGNLGIQAYVSQFKTWSLPTLAPTANRLDIVARNVSEVTIHVQRAKVGCDAALAVDTDGPLTVTLAGCDRQVRYP